MKVVKVKFSDGKNFAIPAKFIAEQRANYYAEKDGVKIGSKEWKEEVAFAMKDLSEVEDWVANNMDWEDVQDIAIDLGGTKECNYHEEWFDQELE